MARIKHTAMPFAILSCATSSQRQLLHIIPVDSSEESTVSDRHPYILEWLPSHLATSESDPFPTFFGVTMESHFISELPWNSHLISTNRQRRMGVEPTRDRAERPPSRFEDGETHRGPYTSMCVAVLCHHRTLLSSQRAHPLHINLRQ